MNAKLPRAFAHFCVCLGSVPALAQADEAAPKPVVIQVCEVALADKLLETKPATGIMSQAVVDEVEAHSPVGSEEWILPSASIGHPFLWASHRAFAEHRPLALSPDMVWQLLTQLAAEEVIKAPEKYRTLFADHQYGSHSLEVRRDEFVPGGKENDWPGVFNELESRIVSRVPGSVAADFSHAFTTSTAAEIAARQVVLLKAASPFYSYQVGTMCGIPRIELHGTVADWKWIRDKVAGLRQFNMERRIKALMPILDECVAASEGKATPAFWKSFYKFASESGSSYVSGWINLFFVAESNKLLDVVLDPKFSWIAPPPQEGRDGAEVLPLAMTTRSYTNKGVVDVDFIWNQFGKAIPMCWRAGFMGVAQDPKSMVLKPVIGWQVMRAKLSSEERGAADYLSTVKTLDFQRMYIIGNCFGVDSKTGALRDMRPNRGGPLDSRFWKKAFPMMVDLEVLNVGMILANQDEEERKPILEAMLSAPAVKVIAGSGGIKQEELQILKDRKDWKVE